MSEKTCPHCGKPLNENSSFCPFCAEPINVRKGGVKIDQHRFASPQDDVIRLDVPVDGGQTVEHPQRAAQLDDDLPGLIGRKKGAFQQEAKGPWGC